MQKILVHTSKTMVNTRIFFKNSGEQSESSGFRGHICNTNSGEQSEKTINLKQETKIENTQKTQNTEGSLFTLFLLICIRVLRCTSELQYI